MKMSWRIHIHIDKKEKGSLKEKKGDKIKRISVDNGNDEKPRGKKSKTEKKLMDGKRSALGFKGGPKSNRRVGKSDGRR